MKPDLKQRAEAAMSAVGCMCSELRPPKMSIPVDKERDEDWLITNVIRDLVAECERERARCIAIVENYKVPVGNSALGERACDLTMDALREIRDAIAGGEE